MGSVSLGHYSLMMESCLNYIQYSWSTKKKRSYKLFRSKELITSSSKRGDVVEEEACRRSKPVILRVYTRKRRHSSVDHHPALAKRSRVDNSDDVETVPKATSDEKVEKHSEDDDDDNIMISDWIRKRRITVDSSREDKGNEEVDVKSEMLMRVGPYEDDDDCTILSERSSGRITSKRKDRRQVELEEDMEWEEEIQLISKIKATSRRRRASHSPENNTCVSISQSPSPASEVSDSLLKNGSSDDCTSLKNTSKESKERNAICHQCLKGERITLLICSVCEDRMYCLQCTRKWYPHLSEDDFAVRFVAAGGCGCGNL